MRCEYISKRRRGAFGFLVDPCRAVIGFRSWRSTDRIHYACASHWADLRRRYPPVGPFEATEPRTTVVFHYPSAEEYLEGAHGLECECAPCAETWERWSAGPPW